jgi:DNA replication protein DnaC
MTVEERWMECVESLRIKFPDDVIATWVKPLQVAEDGDVIRLLAPNEHVEARVRRDFLSWLSTFLGFSGKRVVLSVGSRRAATDESDARLAYVYSQLAKIPEAYKHCTLDSFSMCDERYTSDEHRMQIDAFICIKGYAESISGRYRNLNLIMYGATGTGKTHLSYGLYRHFLDAGYKVMHEQIWTILDEIKGTYRYGSTKSSMDVIKRYIAPDFLIIDEMGEGRQYGTPTEQVELHKLIEGRYSNGRPTIITTNTDKDGIKTALGEGAFRRLAETKDGKGLFITFNWRDRSTV